MIFFNSEVSGSNKRVKYSNNQLNDELSNYSNDNDDTVINGEEAKMEIDEKMEKFGKKKKKVIEEKRDKNKMEIEEEKKDEKENKENLKENKEDKIDDEKGENTLDLNLEKEKNEKKIYLNNFGKLNKF